MAERDQDLPGMEETDRVIKALEDAGHEYAEIRDARVALSAREVKLKKKVRQLMAEHGKTHYDSRTVEVEIEPPDGEDKVRVKVKKPRVTKSADAPKPKLVKSPKKKAGQA